MLYLLLPVHLQNYLVQLCLNLFADFYQLIGMKNRVSRNFVGIIFYTRKVLLTSHYEKRLFEYASQPRVAGSDIRLLSYLWS